MNCKRCDAKIPRGLTFCNSCAKYISRMHDENIMDRVRAATAWINGDRRGSCTEELKVYTFLSLFHPEIPHHRAIQIAKGAK